MCVFQVLHFYEAEPYSLTTV